MMNVKLYKMLLFVIFLVMRDKMILLIERKWKNIFVEEVLKWILKISRYFEYFVFVVYDLFYVVVEGVYVIDLVIVF